MSGDDDFMGNLLKQAAAMQEQYGSRTGERRRARGGRSGRRRSRCT